MYKQRPAKEVSKSNAEKRLEYGHTYQHDTIKDYWQFVAWTDEKHWDVRFTQQSRIFQDAGTAQNPKNTQKIPQKQGTSIHISADIS